LPRLLKINRRIKIKRRVARVRSKEPGRYKKRKTRGAAKSERLPNQDKFYYKRRAVENQAKFSTARRQKKKRAESETVLGSLFIQTFF
jgi:hypothetical protein